MRRSRVWESRSRERPRKNCCSVGVLFYVPANSHADDQLAHLLRLLPLAPQGWVLKAQRTLLEAVGVPDEVLAKLPEVVAHQYEQMPLRARLLTLLIGSDAVAEKIRSAARGA